MSNGERIILNGIEIGRKGDIMRNKVYQVPGAANDGYKF
jgi:hypothetical protein